MVGTIKQKLYVKGIPKGLTMRVTALNLLPPDPAKEWRATLYDSAERERHAPFNVNPSVDGGYIGFVKMYGAHAFPTNSMGARLEILWELTGVATTRGKEGYDVSNDDDEHPPLRTTPSEVDKEELTVDPSNPDSWATKIDQLAPIGRANEPARNGRFLVETTKWGLVQRPDYVRVLYQIGSATPERVESKVAATIIDQPSDALFIIGANIDTQQIAINGVQDKAVADTLTSYLIKGIFYIHEKAFGWVFGKLW